jgi:hypothetical protein
MNLDFIVKCWCGITTHSDKERIEHDCDYYPADIMERDSIWDKS